MTIQQNNNGHQEAANSSKQNDTAGIQLPANDSYQQSLYIAAIARSIGAEGLISPVTDVRDGNAYTFDFYDPEGEQFFKVLRTFNARTYQLYSRHAAHPIVILDSVGIPHQMTECACGCEYLQVNDAKVAQAIYADPYTLIYHDGDLWTHRDHFDGEWTWTRIVPAILQEYVAGVNEDDEEVELEA